MHQAWTFSSRLRAWNFNNTTNVGCPDCTILENRQALCGQKHSMDSRLWFQEALFYLRSNSLTNGRWTSGFGCVPHQMPSTHSQLHASNVIPRLLQRLWASFASRLSSRVSASSISHCYAILNHAGQDVPLFKNGFWTDFEQLSKLSPQNLKTLLKKHYRLCFRCIQAIMTWWCRVSTVHNERIICVSVHLILSRLSIAIQK